MGRRSARWVLCTVQSCCQGRELNTVVRGMFRKNGCAMVWWRDLHTVACKGHGAGQAIFVERLRAQFWLMATFGF